MSAKKVWYDNMRCSIAKTKENTVILILDETYTAEKAEKNGFVKNGENYEYLLKKEDIVEYEGIDCHVSMADQKIFLLPVLWNDKNAKDYQLTIIKSLGIREVAPNLWGIIPGEHGSPCREITEEKGEDATGVTKEGENEEKKEKAAPQIAAAPVTAGRRSPQAKEKDRASKAVSISTREGEMEKAKTRKGRPKKRETKKETEDENYEQLTLDFS